jgi:hypothetical protein
LGGLFCKKSLKNSRHLIYQLVEYICSQALFSMVPGFCGGLKTGKNRNPPIDRFDGSSKPEPTVFCWLDGVVKLKKPAPFDCAFGAEQSAQ